MNFEYLAVGNTSAKSGLKRARSKSPSGAPVKKLTLSEKHFSEDSGRNIILSNGNGAPILAPSPQYLQNTETLDHFLDRHNI